MPLAKWLDFLRDGWDIHKDRNPTTANGRVSRFVNRHNDVPHGEPPNMIGAEASVKEENVMPQTGLFGPHSMGSDTINSVVSANGIGCYALGYISDGEFYVTRIGRSDKNLRNRLLSYGDKYPSFKYGFFDSVRACYEKECQLWHDFRPDDNPYHPDKPDGMTLSCPYPNCDQ